jgi:hypothetical protein
MYNLLNNKYLLVEATIQHKFMVGFSGRDIICFLNKCNKIIIKDLLILDMIVLKQVILKNKVIDVICVGQILNDTYKIQELIQFIILK